VQFQCEGLLVSAAPPCAEHHAACLSPQLGWDSHFISPIKLFASNKVQDSMPPRLLRNCRLAILASAMTAIHLGQYHISWGDRRATLCTESFSIEPTPEANHVMLHVEARAGRWTPLDILNNFHPSRRSLATKAHYSVRFSVTVQVPNTRHAKLAHNFGCCRLFFFLHIWLPIQGSRKAIHNVTAPLGVLGVNPCRQSFFVTLLRGLRCTRSTSD
jgi:hypothetical protein